LIREIFKTLKVMNVGNVRARVFESDKSVFMNRLKFSYEEIQSQLYIYIN
jgi:uncharacterized protein YfkK (UPF0435 family)